MVGVVELREGRGRRPAAVRWDLLGLPCLRAEIPFRPGLGEGRLGRRVDRGSRLLAKAGVRRVVTAADFPCWDRLERSGLRPVEAAGFCQALALPLTLAALERQGVSPARASVVLSGPSVSRALLRAAEELCPRVRRLSVDVPGEGEKLADWLWREFGAAMVSPDAGRRADVALRFGPGGEPGHTTFELYGPRPGLAGFRIVPPAGLEKRGLDTLAVLSLLWEEGRLDLRKIIISST
ncbi:hypothetical protein [Intestinimonas massiliensis (ex Afouda et al. 2020)]|uniref:hypothetical protein n=1 Tax=Intestinimonas massiliensis (ex Afouda et al. 2020) TaxID=1673721 RepID=UPI00102F5255|nr:hypothetical protein [Intestinimonas massiliensis (ex Afouda et al. 2020)]